MNHLKRTRSRHYTGRTTEAVTAKYSAPDLIAESAKVSADIYAALGSKLAVCGAQVINIEMRNFSFQESYMRAINSANLKIATAQAEALRVQNSALAQNKDVLELRRIEVEQTKADRWNGQLPQNVCAGAPIPFLSVSK